METTLEINKDEIIRNSMNYTLTSWSKQKGVKPMVIEKGEGVYLYDADGKRYLDFSIYCKFKFYFLILVV